MEADRGGTYTTKGDIPSGGGTLTITLKVKDDITLDSDGTEVDNTASFTYNDEEYTSTDRIKIKLGFSINKYVSSISSGNAVANRSEYSNDQKESDPVLVGPEVYVTYTIEVTNASTHAISIDLTDEFAAKLSFSSGSWEGSERTYTQEGVTLPGKVNGEKGTYTTTITLQVKKTAVIGTAYKNTVSITLYGTTKRSADWVKVDPGITLDKSISYANGASFNRTGRSISSKSSDPVYVEPGSTITYTIKVTVEIPCTLSFTDTFSSELSWVSSDQLDGSHKGSYTFESKDDVYICTVTLQLSEDVESTGSLYENTFSIDNTSYYDSDYVTCEYEEEEEPEVEVYDLDIVIYKYVTNSAAGDKSRMTNSTKSIYPETVNQGDTVEYTIEVKNNMSATVGSEYGLSVAGPAIKSITLTDTAQDGLVASDSTITLTNIASGGGTASTTMTCNVTMSNMYLYTLYNEVKFSSGTYGKVVIDKHTRTWTETITDEEGNEVEKSYTETWYTSRIVDTPITADMVDDYNYNQDYVQLEDVEIAGDVWLDEDEDGLNNDGSPLTDKEVHVYLYKNDYLYATTIVDDSGHYTFGLQEKGDTPFGRGTRKYDDSSGYNSYYVLFEYFGVDYEVTTFVDGGAVTDSGYTDSNWEIESHVEEIDRQKFNDTFETISYDTAWAGSTAGTDSKVLVYDKEGHESDLTWTESTTIQAKSIDLYLDYGGDGGSETSKADYVAYLKHINLGLIEREQADLGLIKDVVKAYVTINGFETTYEYNGGANDDYHISTPYELNLYYEDYSYRTTNYDQEIADILGSSANDLQIVLTYKITITNESTENYNAVVREVIDIYSEALQLVTDYPSVYDDYGNTYTVSDLSTFNAGTSYSYSGYKVSYITGSSLEQTLSPGQSITFYLDYQVGKNPDGSSEISFDKLTSGAIVLEDKINIAQVGAYSIYESDGTVAGIVDGNSNPGNVVIYGGLDDYDQYEDTIYETNIQILLRTDPGTDNPPGTDDPPGTDNPPGTDDPPGVDNPPEEKDPPSDENIRVISGNVWEDTATDGGTTIDGVTQNTGDGVKNGTDSGAENVTVILMEVVRDGDDEYLIYTGISTQTDSNGDYYLYDETRLHAGEYMIRFVYGENSSEFTTSNGGDTIKYSGQDYKSALYCEDIGHDTVESSEFADVQNGSIMSVAEDNEIRRLEVIDYSTTMTYYLDNILKGGGNLSDLAKNTYMYADTTGFNVRIEEYTKYDSVIEWLFEGGKVETYEISEINFGLVERPQTKLIMAKDISQLTATTSDGSVLVDLIFDIYYYKDSSGDFAHTSVLNKEQSTGYSNVQVLNRSNSNQGFRYVNVDSELLQGMTVTVEYKMAIANTSDIDSSNQILIDLVKSNSVGSAASSLKSSLGKFASTTYMYNGTSSGNELLLSCTTNNIKNANADYELGKYVGTIYYTGEYTGEQIVETRVDQIIDYVDNDMVLTLAANIDENGNGKFISYTPAQIAEYKLLKGVDETTTEITDGQASYITYDNSGNIIKNNLAFSIESEEINGGLYKYLKPLSTASTSTASYVVSSTTVEDSGEINITETTESINNVYDEEDLYTISLQSSVTLSSEEDADGLTIDNISEVVKITNTVGRKAYIENGDDQVAANIGNSNETIEEMYDEEHPEVTITEVVGESDTDYTEYITFSPPTGYTVAELTGQKVVKSVGVTVGILAAIVLAGGIVVIITHNYKKRYK